MVPSLTKGLRVNTRGLVESTGLVLVILVPLVLRRVELGLIAVGLSCPGSPGFTKQVQLTLSLSLNSELISVSE